MKKRFSARACQRASGVNPVPAVVLEGHLKRVNAGLQALVTAEGPQLDAWRDLSDAVNILASLGELGFIADATGEIDRAKQVLAEAGIRYGETGVLRLTGEGINTVWLLLTDYAEVVRSLTERQFYVACRNAEKRIREIRRGNVNPGDKVVAL